MLGIQRSDDGFAGFLFEAEAGFFGTVAAVLKHDGVVEGGTGTLHENNKKS